jgi:hypothetical protein
MLAADIHPHYDITMPNHELLEIHRSKISLHHAKAGYDYPAIRLPFTFSKLARLPTRIYQTVHDGALAFLVVVSSSNKRDDESQKKSGTFATSSRYSYLHGEGRAFESPRAHFAVGDFLYERRLRHNHHAAGVRGLFNRNSLSKRGAEVASLHLYRVRTQRIEKK